MPPRRSFLAGICAAALVPRRTWAQAGSPAYLSAGQTPNGSFVLCGLTAQGGITFTLPLPARGHAAAAHPHRAEAVAFARRPGRFAIILDCLSGEEHARLIAPSGRHFYGHGAFSAGGELLFTTENDYDTARGMVGIWDARHGYVRLGEFPSGGTGPHDIRLTPDGETLVVANGGIETHPDTGRAKLNLPDMRASLSYLDLNGQVLEHCTLGPEHQRNSIRHLAVAGDGTVAFAMQWQGDLASDLPLLGLHHRATGRLQLAEPASIRRMNGYLGSVAISADGQQIATTSPRRGRVQVFEQTALISEHMLDDVCGVAATGAGFMVTTGTGLAGGLAGPRSPHQIAWDNHLIPI